MFNFTRYSQINERLAEINLPELQAKAKIGDFRKKIMDQLDDSIDQFVLKEIETIVSNLGFETQDSKAFSFEQFYYNLKIVKNGFVYVLVVSKSSCEITEGTEEFAKGKDYMMFTRGYRLGSFETIQDALNTADAYSKMRLEDVNKGVYNIFWQHSSKRNTGDKGKSEYKMQSIDPSLLTNEEDLEYELSEYWENELQRDRNWSVPYIHVNGKSRFFNHVNGLGESS